MLAALLAALPAVAWGQEEDGVVVSATRAPRPSLEVPASVDRLYAEEIGTARPRVDLSESLGRVPGIVVQNRQNYAQDLQISSRGFGARSTFGVRGIRLIADGIPATMPDGQGQAATFPLGTAERIEVLRGPFSSLYGNAAGGVIVVQTRDGPEVPTAGIDLYYGRYDTWRNAFRFGGQWGRVNGIGELSRFETDGYREHSAAVRDHLNAKLRLRVSPDTAVTVVANSLRQPDTQDPLGLTREQFKEDPRQAVDSAILFDTRKTVEQDQAGVTLGHRIGAGRVEATVYGGQRFVEQFLAIPLATQSAATHSGGVVNLDRDYGGGALRYSVDVGAAKLSVGLEYESMEERRRGFLNLNGEAGALKRDEDNKVTSTDVYGQAEWQASERLSLHAGARRSRVRFTSDDDFIVPGTANGNDSGSRTFRETTPVAGVLYRVNRTTSLYGTVGRGFETPTFVELAYRPAGGGSGLNFDLDASRSRHAELGIKTLVAGWLRLNAALFDIDTKDEIVVEQNTGGRATFKNAGKTDRRGLELAAETALGGPLEARIAYTFLDATFRDDFSTVAGLPAAPVIVEGGNRLPGVPRNQLFAELRYRGAGFFASVEALHRSRVAVNDLNSEFAPGFTVYGLAVGLMQEGRDWSLTEFVRIDNLTDRNYAGSVIVNDGNGRYYEPSPRRSTAVGIQAALRY